MTREDHDRADREKLSIALDRLSSDGVHEAGRCLLKRRLDTWEVARTVVQLLEGGYEIPPPPRQFDARLAFFQKQLGLDVHPFGSIPREMFFATEAEMIATGKFVTGPERRDLPTLIQRIKDFQP